MTPSRFTGARPRLGQSLETVALSGADLEARSHSPPAESPRTIGSSGMPFQRCVDELPFSTTLASEWPCLWLDATHLKDCCRFGRGTFAGASVNDEVAPKAVVPNEP